MEDIERLLDKATGRDPKRIPVAERVKDPQIRGSLPDVADDLETEPSGKFELELSDFLFLTLRIKNPPALRFTVTWKFDHPKYGLLGVSEEGWLCTRKGDGVLQVSPPINKFGPMQSKQLKTITGEFHQLILAMLVNNVTKSGKSYAGEVGKALLEELRVKQPDRWDPDLPKEIKA